MDLTLAHIPWGRPTATWIPVPPFLDTHEHELYTDTLIAYLALLEPDGPSLASRALALALDGQLERSRDSRDGRASGVWSPHLSELELRVSAAVFFPAQWTPAEYWASRSPYTYWRGDAFADTGMRDDRGRWEWGLDPLMEALPTPEGGWHVGWRAGGVPHDTVLAHHDDLVLLWMHEHAHAPERVPAALGSRRAGGIEDAEVVVAAAAALIASAAGDAVGDGHPGARIDADLLSRMRRAATGAAPHGSTARAEDR